MNLSPNLFLTLYLLESFFTTWAFMKIGSLQPGNIVNLIFFVLVLFFYRFFHRKMTQEKAVLTRSMFLNAAILSLLFTTMYIAVDYRNYIDTLTNHLFQFIVLFTVFAGLFLLLAKLLLLTFLYLSKKELWEKFFITENHFLPFYRKHIFSCSAFLCLLCWIPYFLYQYPGIITPDSLNQFKQVLGEAPYSNHHPWMHTMLIKLCYSVGTLFSDDLVVAFSFYTAFQMIFLACSIGFLLKTVASFGLNTVSCIAINLFYMLVPYHAVYSVTVWKDIPFAAAVLLFCCALLRLQGKICPKTIIIYFLSGFMLCLFRSNGWYAFLFCLPFLLYHFRKKAKVMYPVHALLLLCVLIIRFPVMNAYSVTQPDFTESISIPLQQVAAVICYDRPLQQEQYDLIEEVIDLTYIKELYVPTFADNMKELVRAGNQEYLTAHKKEFFKLWLDLFFAYPKDYMEAYVWQTYGYWYPDSFYPVADNEGVSASYLGVSHSPIIGGPIVIKAKEISLKLGGMVPLYGLLWSMGAATWILLLCIGCAFVRGEKNKLIYYLPCFSLLLTVLVATPVATDFRYLYFLFLTLPLYLFIAIMQFPSPPLSATQAPPLPDKGTEPHTPSDGMR